jgi:hypothetical protein
MQRASLRVTDKMLVSPRRPVLGRFRILSGVLSVEIET